MIVILYFTGSGEAMDHIVYMDYKAREFEKISSGEKTMLIRGAMGRKVPYGRVEKGDCLFLIENNASGIVKSKCIVSNVFNSEKLSAQESNDLILENQEFLKLTALQLKRWSGKRYIVLVAIKEYESIESFKIDKSEYSNMDDWLLIGKIERVKK